MVLSGFTDTLLSDVTKDELKELLHAAPDTFVLLDVRSEEEVADGSFRDALHIPIEEIEFRIEELNQFHMTQKKILCFCRVGGRSDRVAGFLRNLGFNALNIGGYVDVKRIAVDPG